MPMIMAYNGFIPATRILDPVQPEHAIVLAAGQLLPEVVAIGHANATKVPIMASRAPGTISTRPPTEAAQACCLVVT